MKKHPPKKAAAKGQVDIAEDLESDADALPSRLQFDRDGKLVTPGKQKPKD